MGSKKLFLDRIKWTHDKMVTTLFEDKNGKDFAVGEHIFPFTFVLPDHLPDTFKAAKGAPFHSELKVSQLG